MSLPELSLMMCIYNEESCLEEVVDELVLALKPFTYELHLVNNGSTDSSQRIIEKLVAKYPDTLRSIHIPINKKLGGAVNEVTRTKLHGNIIGFTCADGEVSAANTAKMIRHMLANPEVSLAKTIRLNRTDGIRKYVSRVYNWLVRIMFGVKTDDINGWPVLVRYDAFRQMDLGDYSWIFQLEYQHQLRQLGKKIFEMEVEHEHRRGGVTKVKPIDMYLFFQQMVVYRVKSFAKRAPARLVSLIRTTA